MKKLFIIISLIALSLAPCLHQNIKASPDAQQECLALSTGYVYSCLVDHDMTYCTQHAHDDVYCPCMHDRQPDVPAQGCQEQ